jgi:hypothetical protein
MRIVNLLYTNRGAPKELRMGCKVVFYKQGAPMELCMVGGIVIATNRALRKRYVL